MKTALLAITILIMISFGCRPRRSVESEDSGTVVAEEPDVTMTEEVRIDPPGELVPDELRQSIVIDPLGVDSMEVLIGDKEIFKEIKAADRATICELLATATYDTGWNDSGIMVKMIAPDYQIVIHFNDQNRDNAWIPVWKESGRVKYQDFWFNLPGNSIDQMTRLIEQYR